MCDVTDAEAGLRVERQAEHVCLRAEPGGEEGQDAGEGADGGAEHDGEGGEEEGEQEGRRGRQDGSGGLLQWLIVYENTELALSVGSIGGINY